MEMYNNTNYKEIKFDNKIIYDFTHENDSNTDVKTVESFGEEWKKFKQFDSNEISNVGDEYFDILPNSIDENSYVLDMGCGSGRWTKYIAKSVKFVEAIDPSDAIFVASNLLKNENNIRVSKASVESIPFNDNTFDLVFSLGVLHHIPNTKKAMQICVDKVKPGGWFLVYLYYNLDNRGYIYKAIFKTSVMFRIIISRLPNKLKHFVCHLIALLIYYPLILLSKLLEKLGLINLSNKVPLSYYKNKSWNIIKNDALDRFGTPLEQRFSKKEIEKMMRKCGLTNIRFSELTPYWHAVGQKQ